MKKTKFRVWDKIEKKMMYGGFIVSADGQVYTSNQGDLEEMKDVVLMQYICTDVLLKDVYEDDIVEVPAVEEGLLGFNERHRVMYFEEEASYAIATDTGLSMNSTGPWKLIGNIWEQPNILEEV